MMDLGRFIEGKIGEKWKILPFSRQNPRVVSVPKVGTCTHCAEEKWYWYQSKWYQYPLIEGDWYQYQSKWYRYRCFQ